MAGFFNTQTAVAGLQWCVVWSSLTHQSQNLPLSSCAISLSKFSSSLLYCHWTWSRTKGILSHTNCHSWTSHLTTDLVKARQVKQRGYQTVTCLLLVFNVTTHIDLVKAIWVQQRGYQPVPFLLLVFNVTTHTDLVKARRVQQREINLSHFYC